MKTSSCTTKGNPVPVRFGEKETAFLEIAHEKTGLPTSELVRRAVRLMRRQEELVRGFSFVVDLAA